MSYHNPSSAGNSSHLRAIIWLVVSLTVFACLPEMMSGNYLPKTFWAALTVGLGLALILPRRPYSLRLSLLGLVWISYLGWALLSLSWAVAPRVGFERWLALLLPTLAYLLARRSRFWESDLFWKLFCVLTGLVSIIGILQYFFPSLPLIHSFPGTAVPRGTLGHRNYASMYFMVTLPFIAWYYFRARGWPTLLPFSSLILGTAFMLLAKTRGAWLSLIVGVIFFLAAGGLRKIYQNLRRVLIAAGMVFILLVMIITVQPPSEVAGLMASKADFLATAAKIMDTHVREKLWRESLGLTDPLIGAGFGNLPIVATPSAPEAKVKTLNWEVHNDYLQAYVDLGIPGLLLFCLTFAFLILLAWKGKTQGLILGAGVSIVGIAVMQFTTFTSEKVGSQIWLAGVAAILNAAAGERPVIKFRVPGWAALGTNYLTVIWLIVFSVIVGYTIRGDRELRRDMDEIQKVLAYQEILDNSEQYSAREVDFVRKQGLYDRLRIQNRLNWLLTRVLPAMSFDANMRHISCHQLAGLAMSMKEYSTAGAFARKALELHPNDLTSLAYLAKIAMIEGQNDEALGYLKQGVEVFGYNPYAPFFCVHLAGFYRQRGMYIKVMQIEEKLEANRIRPPDDLYPANMSKDIPIDLEFDWNDCCPEPKYDLYIWETGEEAPEEPIISGITSSRVRLKEELEPGKVYIWRVRAVGRYGEELGDPWVFRTKKMVCD